MSRSTGSRSSRAEAAAGPSARRHGSSDPMRLKTLAAARPHLAAAQWWYLGAFGFDVLADEAWYLCLAWQAVHGGASSHAAVVMTVATLPRTLLMFAGGAVVDRLGAPRIATLTYLARLALMATMCAVVFRQGQPGADIVLAVSGSVGALDALHLPAVGALPRLLLDADRLVSVQALRQTAYRLSTLAAGPMVGGLLAVGGQSLALTAILICIALAQLPLAVLLHRSVPRPSRKASPLSSDPSTETAPRWASWRSLLSGEVLGVLCTVAATNVLGTAPLFLGIPLLVEHHHWPTAAYGWIMLALSAGATIGAVFSVRKTKRSREVRGGSRWLASSGLALAFLTVPTSWQGVAIVMMASGFCMAPAGALLIGHVQRATPEEHIGKVTALSELASMGAQPISYAIFGLLVTTTSVPVAITAMVLSRAGVGSTTAVLAHLPHRPSGHRA